MRSPPKLDSVGPVLKQGTPTHSMVLRSACRICCNAGEGLNADKANAVRHKHSYHHHHSHSSAKQDFHIDGTANAKKNQEKIYVEENSALNGHLTATEELQTWVDKKQKSSSRHGLGKNSSTKAPLISEESVSKDGYFGTRRFETVEVKTVESIEETHTSLVETIKRQLFNDDTIGNSTFNSEKAVEGESEYSHSERNHKSKATNSESHERLSMSRTRIHGRAAISSARVALPSDSESENEDPFPSMKTRTRVSKWHGRMQKPSTFPLSAFSSQNSRKNLTTNSVDITSIIHSSQNDTSHLENNKSTMRHIDASDMEYSDVDEFDWKNKGRERSKAVDSFLTIVATKIMTIRIVERIAQCLSWLMWKTIYHNICNVLLIDTWILSRCSSIGKKKIILLLLILPLLWMCGWPYLTQDNIKAVLSSPVNLISSTSSVLSTLSSSLWLKKDHMTSDSGSSNEIFIEENSKRSWASSLWSVVGGIFPESTKQDHTTLESQSHSSKHYVEEHSEKDTEYIKSVVQSVFKQEVAKLMIQLAKQQESFSDKQANELSQHTRKLEDLHSQLKTVLIQSQHLSDELLQVKEQLHEQIKVSKLEREESIARSKGSTVLEDKLEEVENRIHSLQQLIEAMKNCCTNHTNYASGTEGHIADLLMEAIDGSRKGSHSVFADFSSWLQRNFINESTLSERINVIEDHIKADVSSSVKQQAEDSAKLAASTVVAKSIDLLKEEVTEKASSLTGFYVPSHDDQHCTSEDNVKKIVKDAISLYDADKTGLVDYALESAGGSIINTRCSETYQASTGLITMFGIPLWYTSTSPRTVIQPGCYPGQCWSFKGSQGYLVIALSATVRPTAFSLEHIPKSLSPTGSIDSAPKEFSVWGLTKENDLEGTLLGQYEYNKDGDSLQHFTSQNPDPGYFSIVELRIHSNHGNLDYTCLYRFRVHGIR